MRIERAKFPAAFKLSDQSRRARRKKNKKQKTKKQAFSWIEFFPFIQKNPNDP